MLSSLRSNTARIFRAAARRIDPSDPAVPQPVPPAAATPAPTAPDPLDQFFESLRRLDFHPRHIVDIGANRGHWTQTALRYFPDAHYTLLEPQPAMRANMQDLLDGNPRVTLHSVGAGSKSGDLTFTITERDDSCTFCMSPDEARSSGLTQVQIPVVALDDLLAQSQLPHPDIIKIDAEGFDLEVLKGTANAVRSSEIVLIEAAVTNKSFVNDVRTVIEELFKLDFRLLDITDLNRTQKDGCLWLVELAFVRRGGALDSRDITYELDK